MQNYPWDQTIVGWIHITSAALVAGGLMFWAFFLRRAGLEAERRAIFAYRPWLWTAAAALLLTGMYTWSVRWQSVPPYPSFYFHVLYTKIALWVALFGVAGIATPMREGRSPAPWLRAAVVIVIAILFLSAFMRRVKPVELSSVAAVPAAQESPR